MAPTRKAAHAFARNFYGHTYYLSPQEQKIPIICRKSQTAEDYAAYSDVFPDKKAIANYKHCQSLQREQDAALALINK